MDTGMNETMIFKGGGYGYRDAILGAMRPRFQSWYGTTDQPRDLVPPVTGGLPKRPSAWKIIKAWIVYHVKWFVYFIRLGKNP
jgi:hypothetical protein